MTHVKALTYVKAPTPVNLRKVLTSWKNQAGASKLDGNMEHEGNLYNFIGRAPEPRVQCICNDLLSLFKVIDGCKSRLFTLKLVALKIVEKGFNKFILLYERLEFCRHFV